MIADALMFLAEQARASVAPVLVSDGPTTQTYLVDDEAVTVLKHTAARAHTVESIACVMAIANRFNDEDNNPVVWVSTNKIVLVIDDTRDRVETATMPLDETDVFKRLRRLNAGEWLDQKAFVRLLRIDLARTLPPGVLLDRVRKIRFEAGQVTTGEVARNRESLGRQITAAVNAEGEIPEMVTLAVPVYPQSPAYAVQCSVDVDPVRGLFELKPLPDEIERVSTVAVSEIADMIKAEVNDGILVYLGRP